MANVASPVLIYYSPASESAAVIKLLLLQRQGLHFLASGSCPELRGQDVTEKHSGTACANQARAASP